jgi:hypothetical protein
MWIFTRYGFFSAVAARLNNGKHGQPVDPNRIMVRARLRDHLEGLRCRFPDQLGSCEILEHAGSDYAYRIFVDKPVWREVVAALVEETDYDNFKSEAARHLGKKGIAYERALHDVWSDMRRLQK